MGVHATTHEPRLALRWSHEIARARNDASGGGAKGRLLRDSSATPPWGAGVITAAQVDVWRSSPTELPQLEFKEAKHSFDIEKLYEYCVAIANEGGGHLVLGITDRPPRAVVGTAAFPNPVKVVEQVQIKVGFHIEMMQVDHQDGRVLVVRIPSRPRGTAYQLEGRYLMRAGASLRSMSEDKLREIFDEGKPDWLEEVSLEAISGQQVIELLDIQTYFELLKEPFPTDQNAILEKLVLGRMLIRKGDRFDLPRLSGLLLARRLTDFKDVARKAPRVIVYSGASKVETKLEQLGVKGYAVGFRGLVAFIMSQLPQNEVVEEAIRRQVKLLPELAIRELVANALIHQDFMMTGASVMIDIYSDRIEISNPGDPIVEVNRFIDGYQSRNERLADVMRRMGVCEEKGSGIDKVISLVEAYQLPAPNFRSELKRTAVVLAGPKLFDEMDRDERIRACYQHTVLKRMMNEFMTNQSLRERFKLPDAKGATVSQVITQTLDAGLIKPDETVGESLKLRRYLPFWA